MDDTVKMFQAAIVCANDWPTRPINALFIHGMTQGSEGNAFTIARDFYRNKVEIAINGSDGERVNRTVPGEAWPGKNDWVGRMQELGIKEVSLTRPAFHSKDENNALVELAQQAGWKSLGVIAPPYHILRCMLGLIKSMADKNYAGYAAAISPKINWCDKMPGPQGEVVKTGIELVADNWERIVQYQTKGDLCSLEEYFQYIRDRENL